MKRPLVSVVIPTYKRQKLLKRAIKSVINQSYNNIEIIVVNDNPKSKIHLKQFNYGDLVIINHEKNLGGAAARNTGIKSSNGKYVAFLDDDDLFLPKKIEKQVNIMENLSNKWVGCYSWSKLENGIVRKPIVEGDLSNAILKRSNDFCLSSTSIFAKRDLIESIGGFDEDFQRLQDLEFMIRLCKEGKIKLIKEPLFIKKEENTPDPESAFRATEKFLKKFESEIEKFSKKERNKIYSSHYFNVVSISFKQGGLVKGLSVLKRSLNYSYKHSFFRYSTLVLKFLKGIVKIINKKM